MRTRTTLMALERGDIFSFSDGAPEEYLGLRAARHAGDGKLIEGIVTFAQGLQVVAAWFRPLDMQDDLVVTRFDNDFVVTPNADSALVAGQDHPAGSLVLNARDGECILATDEYANMRVFALRTGLEPRAGFNRDRSYEHFTIQFVDPK